MSDKGDGGGSRLSEAQQLLCGKQTGISVLIATEKFAILVGNIMVVFEKRACFADKRYGTLSPNILFTV